MTPQAAAAVARQRSGDPNKLRPGDRAVHDSSSRYASIIEALFLAKHTPNARAVDFEHEDLVVFARQLGIGLPKNLGDVIYSFRYRTKLPPSVLGTAPEGKTWIIRSAGRSKYRFVLVSDMPLAPKSESVGHANSRLDSRNDREVCVH